MKKSRWIIGPLAVLVMIGFLAYQYWGWEGVVQVFKPLCNLISGINKEVASLILKNLLTSSDFIADMIVFVTSHLSLSPHFPFGIIYGFADIASILLNLII